MSQRPVKRSIVIEGHATSVSLESDFWQVLDKLARQEGLSRAEIIKQIDQARDPEGTTLSGAIRLYLLARLRQISGV